MSTDKRKRDETDEVDDVLNALEQCSGKEGADTKIIALKDLIALIEPTDESYEVQRRAAERVLNVLMQLLEDDSTAVSLEAANALAALSDHAGAVKDRLEAGFFAATAEKVALNPVQEAVGALDGVFRILVDMSFSDDEAVAAAGSEALAALTSLNRANTLSLMHEVVHRLVQGEGKALGALDDLVAGMDIRDDASVLLDQALSPALGFLRTGSTAERVAAATLLGNIAEGRRGAAIFLVAEGALPDAVGLLVKGDLEVRDACAHLVWALVKHDRKLLAPSKEALGMDGVKLVEPLLDIVEKGDEGAEGSEEISPDNGDSALLLLRALAAQDADVEAKLKADGAAPKGGKCTIM